MAESQIAVHKANVNEQLGLWRAQVNSIPSLLGGKSVWVPLVTSLVQIIGDSTIRDLESSPAVPPSTFQLGHSSGGVDPRPGPATWREYLPFLRGAGLAQNGRAGVTLTATGHRFLDDPRPVVLGSILADRVRLFAEVLSIVASGDATVEDVHEKVQEDYRPSWKNLAGTRVRMDWQEMLGLIAPAGNRRWAATREGLALLNGRVMVTPEAFERREDMAVEVPPAPQEISALLDELRASDRDHQSRSTYNIWAPSPPACPNKVENLRTIVNAALTRIDRAALLGFICDTFGLRRSSVESMMPFMRAAGLIEEVGRGVYEATPAAKAWIESGEDVDFVRILHAHMRFVGEMIRAVDKDVKRKQVYSAGKAYGLNTEKCRWIASFLMNAGLIEEPRYGSLRATAMGRAVRQQLPLAEVLQDGLPAAGPAARESTLHPPQAEESLKERLVRLAVHPYSDGSRTGSEFESAVRDAFLEMGFHSRVIGGPGNPDVLVQWQDDNGELAAAVVEVKTRSSGYVAHTDVSDVALETHKARNNARFVAVVGPAFSGETIRDMADQRGWSLIEAERLGAIAEAVCGLGLRPCEAAALFRAVKGLAELDEVIADKTKELDVVSFVLCKLREETEEEGEAISARDISRDGRKSELAPSVSEVLAVIEQVASLPTAAVRRVDGSERPEYVTYVLGDVSAGARRLRALAEAIERPAAT